MEEQEILEEFCYVYKTYAIKCKLFIPSFIFNHNLPNFYKARYQPLSTLHNSISLKRNPSDIPPRVLPSVSQQAIHSTVTAHLYFHHSSPDSTDTGCNSMLALCPRRPIARAREITNTPGVLPRALSLRVQDYPGVAPRRVAERLIHRTRFSRNARYPRNLSCTLNDNRLRAPGTPRIPRDRVFPR